MIMLLHIHLAKNLRRILTPKHVKTYTNALRSAFPIRKSEPPTKKIHILPKLIVPCLIVVKCGSKKPANLIQEDIFSPVLIKFDETFDWKKLWEFLSPDLWRLIVAILAAVVAAFINVQLPIHLGKVIDILNLISSSVKPSVMFSQIEGPALKLLYVYVIQAFFTFVYVHFISTVGENLAINLKTALFASILQQDLSFFEVNRTGEILDRLTTDVYEFKSAFKLCISQGLRSSTQICGCLLSLISISPEMTGVVILILPTVILIGSMLGDKLRKMSKTAQDQAAWSTIIAEEIISNIRTVRSFAMEEHECGKFEEEVKKTGDLYKDLGFGIALFQAGTNIFLNSIVLITLAMGGYMLSMRRLSAGNVMAFLVAMQTIQRSLTQFSLLLGHFVKGMSCGGRVFQFINMKPKVSLHMEDKRTTTSFSADIRFDDVTFSYPTRPNQKILKHLNLSIPAGKVAAIVGTSGNGKSTVAALLLRLYQVNEGAVKISDTNINDLDETWLRRNIIGCINQEPVLFATTIKENIRYGKPNATDEEVYEAAALANAHEFIGQFPNGYDTKVGEKGASISGGQKQRIAMARAFLKKPKILVLDEATSALDTISENQVQKSLESVMKDCTVLIIAHRLSTIRNADIIVVLDKGVVVEVGQHDDLIKKKGFYWDLMNQQDNEKIAH